MEKRDWKEPLISLLFPRRCPVCGEVVQPFGHLICPKCVKELSPVKQPVCLRCGKEIDGGVAEYCPDCTKKKRTFERNFALLNYDGVASRSMSAVKYRGRREYLDFYGQAVCLRYGRAIRRASPDVIVPVPVHPSRKRQRGFNQAELLAERIGRRLEIPVCAKGLRRVKKTLPQKQLNQEERLRNLQRAFVPGRLPKGVRTVLLVDDIYTTGSTMEACGQALKTMGVEKVYGVTLCIGRNS